MFKKVALAAIVLGGMSNSVLAEEIPFTDISSELAQMQNLFTGNYSDGVIFDINLAKSQGYSKKAIKISLEMSILTNKLISIEKNKQLDLLEKKNSTKDMLLQNRKTSNVNLLNYPELTWFMGNLKKQHSKKSKTAISEQITTLGLFDATEICGSFWNPKPTQAADWEITPITSLNHAKSILYVSGYIDAENGPGWSRPRSYQSWICNEGSFRDHATVNNANTKLYIQDYAGFTPRGEPNPDISTYLWPYAAWPSYVFWWHANY